MTFFGSTAALVIMTAALILGIVFAIAYFIRSRSPLFFLGMAFTFIGFIFAIARTTCLSENLTAGQTIWATSFIITLGIGSIVCLFLIWKRTTANVLKAMRIICKIIEPIAKTVMVIMIFVLIPIYLFPNSPLPIIFPHNIQEWVQNSHAWFITIATAIVITWKFLDLFLYEENSSNLPKNETKRTENGSSVMPKTTLTDFLLHHTQARELCVITVGGWINATFFIDHEDLFARYIHKDLRDRTVKSHRWDTVPIVDSKGNKLEVPAHFIEID